MEHETETLLTLLLVRNVFGSERNTQPAPMSAIAFVVISKTGMNDMHAFATAIASVAGTLKSGVAAKVTHRLAWSC